MMDKTPEEIRARLAAANIAWFQRELDAEMDPTRYNILVALLAHEYERFEKCR
jgi:hypothetical protein